MKHAKHLLALLLSFTLMFAFATLAFAAEEEEPALSASVIEEEEPASSALAAEEEEPVLSASAVDWDEFYIITQPEHFWKINSLQTLKLSVEVNVPAGVVVEYQWYCGDSPIPGATSAVLQLKPGDADHPRNREHFWYYCKITGMEKNGDVVVSQQQLISGALSLHTRYYELKRDIPASFRLAAEFAFQVPLQIIREGNGIIGVGLLLLSPITYIIALLGFIFIAFAVAIIN